MSYEFVGKLVAKMDINQRTPTFKMREFVVSKTENVNGREYTNFVKFQCVQDKTLLPDRFSIGDEVKVFFNLKGNRSDRDGRTSYFTNLDAWRMENVKLATDTPAEDFTYNDMPPPAENVDDLPF